MSIEIGLLISLASLVLGLHTGIASTKRQIQQDSRQEVSEMTTVLVKLENICAGIAELKGEFNFMRQEVKDIRDRLIATEESLRAAWKRIEGDGKQK